MASQLFFLDAVIKKRVKFPSLCVCLSPKSKSIDYNAPFSSSKCKRRFDKASCRALPPENMMVVYNRVCGCLTAPDAHVTVVLFNAHLGPSVTWPTSLYISSCSVSPPLPYLQVCRVGSLLHAVPLCKMFFPAVTSCTRLLLFPGFLW